MSQAGETICHPGIIEKVDDQMVYVKILSASACSSCDVKGACHLAESTEKIIEIRKHAGVDYALGKPVDVVMEKTSGTKAVVLAYLVPFGIVVTALFILITSGISEGASALFALGLLIPYYFVLSLFRDRLKKDFEFNVQFK